MKYLTLIILVFYNPLCSQSLQEVVQSALEYNKQIKEADMQSKAAEQDLLREERNQLPGFSLNARYAHATEQPQINLPTGNTVILNPYDTYETSLQVDYIVFSGFAQSESRKVKAFEHKISSINGDQKTKEIAFTAIQTYRNAQFMKLSLEILGDALKRNKVQMSRAKALLENGMALRLDTLSLALNKLDIQQQIIQSHSVMENWLQLLKSLNGKEVTISDASSLSNLPSFNSYRLEEQGLFKNVRLQQQKLSAFKEVARANYYPKVFISASYNYGRPGIDVIENKWNSYAKWMVGMQWNIWNWWADQAALNSSDLKFKALQYNEETLKDQLQLNYDAARRALESLKKQYNVALLAVKVAHEKMNIIEVNAKNGQLAASDFNEANIELSQAHLRQKQILVQLNLKASELDYLSGTALQNWRY